MSSSAGQNYDAAELARFDALASRWWDPEGDFRPLHAINPLRLDWIRQQVVLDGVQIADIGCGGGLLTEAMAAAGARVTGIDMAEAALSVARLHGAESGVDVRYERVTAEELATREPAAFDVVTCLEMLEHVPDPAAVVTACATLVKPGGMVFFSTINRTAKAFLFAIVGAEYLMRLLPPGTHEYRKFIRPSELEEWSRNAGLQLGRATGMHYNPVAKSYSLGPGLEVNYLQSYHRGAQD